MNELYNEKNQNSSESSTTFEDLLGDAIESAFTTGVDTLEGLVARLNQSGPPCPLTTGEWTQDAYQKLMNKLGY
ncbi:hypothetical protein QM092_24755 [Enterobacter hormaechei]|uniref:recombinase-like helix-turn-helix domain-containing protein n=1 Tax=Enterobacter hormaechei TaxID=158836 RepID=UPI00294910C3|nr:recombinase-like helix-turn-helix domain-containing protein [Enterobacter hormaechei]MDV5373160.1 hypothetical protein [Enterobacter hormaechei]